MSSAVVPDSQSVEDAALEDAAERSSLARKPRFRWSAAASGAVPGALAGLLLRDLDLPALVSYEGQREPLVITAALLGAFVAAVGYRWVVVLPTLCLAALWCLVAFSPLSSWLSHGLARSELVEPADAVFVSFSSLRPGAHRSAEVRNRLLYGVDLVARGKAPRLVLTETTGIEGVALARHLMESAGVAADQLVVAGRAESTRDEALVVGQLARERGFKLILLVTSPIHSLRASAALEKEGARIVSTPSAETRFDLETLNTCGDRLAAFGSVLHERLGLWVYARRGWISEGIG
jgi:uncharacterized SAM-binding protein YcdF (DUF218 family)